jgi:hypothetical protein
VQVWVTRAPKQSRVLALLSLPFFLARFILLFPAVVVLYFVGIAALVVAWLGMWGVLFSGSYPERMHRFVTGYLRWNTRVSAYLMGLTDAYPPFNTQP